MSSRIWSWTSATRGPFRSARSFLPSRFIDENACKISEMQARGTLTASLGDHFQGGGAEALCQCRVGLVGPVRHLQLGRLAAELGGQVAEPVVVDDGRDAAIPGVVSGQLEAGGHVAARADATEDALLSGQPSGNRDRLVGAHLDDPVQHVEVEHLWHEAVPDPLDPVRAPRTTAEDRALGGLHRVDADASVPSLEVPPAPRHGAAGALRGGEGVDPAAELAPEFAP